MLTVNIDEIPMLKDAAGPGIHIQTLRLDPERGELVILATMAPGVELPIHYHTGTAEVYTLSGRWEYREYPDQPQTAGSYLYEPAGGDAHVLHPGGQHRGHRHPVVDAGRAGQLQRGRHLPLPHRCRHMQYLTETVAAAQGVGPVPYIRRRRRRA